MIAQADPAIAGYATLQFHVGGFFDGHPVEDVIHLVRRYERGGTPGPTLCGRGRFEDDRSAWAATLTAPWKGDGWSVGGGITGPMYSFTACPACVAVADPALPLWGSTFRSLFANPEWAR
jgi:hypothetical protein